MQEKNKYYAMDAVDFEEGLDMLGYGLNAIAAIQHAIAEGVHDSSSWSDGLLYIIIKMEDELKALCQLYNKAPELKGGADNAEKAQ